MKARRPDGGSIHNMKLSTLYTAVPDYIEVGWVCAPNAASQSISANTITLLTLDTEVQDTGNLVSAPSNNLLTIPAGTYYFEAYSDIRATNSTFNGSDGRIFSLWNNSDSQYITRQRKFIGYGTAIDPDARINGQFVISSSKDIGLRVLLSMGGQVGQAANSAHTTSTAGADQRTTIKLWKLK
jgi:hypothetical protein